MADKRVVIPDDMGKTIGFGALEPDKWNVKLGAGLRVNANGEIELDLCSAIKKLQKVNHVDGSYAVGITPSNECRLIKIPAGEDPFDFTCKLPYKVESESNLATKNDRIGLTYTFTNNYDNAVSFKFLISDAASQPFELHTAPTKVSGGGTVRNLNNRQVNVQVENLPAGQEIKFNIAVRPLAASNYSFSVHGLADTTGGNSSGLNTCGNGVSVRVLDGGQ